MINSSRFLKVTLTIGLLVLSFYLLCGGLWRPIYVRIIGEKTVADIVSQYGPSSMKRLLPLLKKAGFSSYPERIAILAFKDERILEVWGYQNGKWIFIRKYPFTGYSGQLGPKLKNGDRQIPEGVYPLIFLNPNSQFHLSIQIGYPNSFDKLMAMEDQRSDLGGDIFIHGNSLSIGCIPVGDEAIEDLFILVEAVGLAMSQAIVSPRDFRTKKEFPGIHSIVWEEQLYNKLAQELAVFKEK
ncbi:MAG: L,D-transpeptidase family protein [Candidatus Omnitrophica bacterium]|nr:L,D-transpeptidase family protein [Candidatus Omnitrophota bacterium]